MSPKKQAMSSLFFGGLLPVIAFTLIEDRYGVLWGVVAGMVFGVGEMSLEWLRERKVSAITLGGNLFILVLGGISLLTQEGVWFKLQPAIMEGVFAAGLFISWFMKKPLLLWMMEKQRGEVPAPLREAFPGMTFRMGVFFLIHTVLATWAALKWSTQSWALLKGVGFTLSFVLYMAVEILLIRRRLRQRGGSGK